MSARVESSGSDEEEGIGVQVAQHYNQLEEKGISQRKQSKIIHMRNFNNWMKSMLIGEFVKRVRGSKAGDYKLTVLDIGCGKGGDLQKWRKAGIRHLIATDIAETSVMQFKDRYMAMWSRDRGQPEFSAEFIVADATKEDLKAKFRDQGGADLVSCQFMFHYSFESLPQAEQMMKNAAENLKPGGFFIGTTPDAYDIMRRLELCGGKTFGNSIYNIRFDDGVDRRQPLFGAKYNFHLQDVVDCPEFLVHFPTVERIAEKYGLILVHRQRFQTAYNTYIKTQEGKNLMENMACFETYPSRQHEQNQDPNFAHAHRYIQQKQQQQQQQQQQLREGTISKEEWEAISLYICFAFKKLF